MMSLVTVLEAAESGAVPLSSGVPAVFLAESVPLGGGDAAQRRRGSCGLLPQRPVALGGRGKTSARRADPLLRPGDPMGVSHRLRPGRGRGGLCDLVGKATGRGGSSGGDTGSSDFRDWSPPGSTRWYVDRAPMPWSPIRGRSWSFGFSPPPGSNAREGSISCQNQSWCSDRFWASGGPGWIRRWRIWRICTPGWGSGATT